MKKTALLIVATLLLFSTAQAQYGDYQVSYIAGQQYFIKNTVPDGVKIYKKITTQQQFDKLFGAAALMHSMPTPINFSNQFVIAVLDAVSNTTEKLIPVTLVEKNKVLTLTYLRVDRQKPMSYKIRVPLIVIVSKAFENDKINVVLANKGNISKSCYINQYLLNPKISKFAKRLYLGQVWWTDSRQVFDMYQKLCDPKTVGKPFYFKILCGSPIDHNPNHIIDGGLAEGIASSLYDYVKNHTRQFAVFFDDTACFNHSDLEGLAQIGTNQTIHRHWSVYSKYLMSPKKDSSIAMFSQLFENFCKGLKKNCATCSASQKETINTFCKMVIKDSKKLYVKEKPRDVPPPHPDLNRKR